MKASLPSIPIEHIAGEFSVCKVEDLSLVDLSAEYTFAATTDAEKSLVCRSALVPGNAYEVDDGWSLLRVPGQLDFSLVGILARITGALAEQGIPVFAISTFDTDYLMVKGENLEPALDALRDI